MGFGLDRLDKVWFAFFILLSICYTIVSRGVICMEIIHHSGISSYNLSCKEPLDSGKRCCRTMQSQASVVQIAKKKDKKKQKLSIENVAEMHQRFVSIMSIKNKHTCWVLSTWLYKLSYDIKPKILCSFMVFKLTLSSRAIIHLIHVSCSAWETCNVFLFFQKVSQKTHSRSIPFYHPLLQIQAPTNLYISANDMLRG